MLYSGTARKGGKFQGIQADDLSVHSRLQQEKPIGKSTWPFPNKMFNLMLCEGKNPSLFQRIYFSLIYFDSLEH